ncbi:protein kinase [Acidobacteriota bacterium]
MMINKIGKYTITGEIGKGAMGVVYRGTDPYIGRTLAVKTIRFDVIDNPADKDEAQRRFMREAQSAGNLSHPNIVTIYEVGEDAGMTYIAMEHIDGRSLEDILASGRKFSLEEITELMNQLGNALDYAHQNGVIHRDIKPANILIDGAGNAHLLDFGIARITSSNLTQTNTVMGTPFYMSPEQIAGKRVNNRSDIFSLGTILYELLTLKKPFPGDNVTTIIYKIVNEPPLLLRSQDEAIPVGLEHVIEKSLAKKPEDRYSSCRELIEDLRNYSDILSEAETENTRIFTDMPAVEEEIPAASSEWMDEPDPIQTAAPKSRKPALIVLASAMGVLIVVLAIIFISLNDSGNSGGGVPLPIDKPGDTPVKSEQPPALSSQLDFEKGAKDAFSAGEAEELDQILAEGMKKYRNSSKLWVYRTGYYSLEQTIPNFRKLARDAATTAVNLDPEDLDNYYELGQIFQKMTGDYASALDYYRKGETKGLIHPELSYNMALCFEKLKKPRDSITYYERFLAASPDHRLAGDAKTRLSALRKPRHSIPQSDYEDAAWAMIIEKNLDDLGAKVETGLKYYPGSSKLRAFKAIVYLQERDNPRFKELALESANKALELDPTDALNYAVLKPVYGELEDEAGYKKREKEYARSYPEIYYRLAQFYDSVKEEGEAEDYCELFLEVAPNHNLAQDARRLLANLQEKVSGERENRISTLRIDSQYFTFYPAVFVSLDEAEIIKLPPSEEELMGARVAADLWIEVRDMEIGGLPGEIEGIDHTGSDTKLAVVEGLEFEALTSVPPDVEWKNVIYKRDVKVGLIFLVSSSSEKIYKVRVDEFDRERNTMSLSFSLLR